MRKQKKIQYLPRLSFDDYSKWMVRNHQKFSTAVWFDHRDLKLLLEDLLSMSNEFEGNDDTGRGESYRESQKNIAARVKGIKSLFEIIFSSQDPKSLPENFIVLDVLGGNGTLFRAFELIYGTEIQNPMFTSDMAGEMIQSAYGFGIPCIRQKAQNLLLKDQSMDGVILAYGTHHIPKKERLQAVQEAHRVLKNLGNLLIHDFEIGSAMDHWFKEVVHRYSPTGHDYPHFSKAEMNSYFIEAGFRNHEIIELYDPFCVSATSEELAIDALLDYVGNMYGLHKLVGEKPFQSEKKFQLLKLIEKYFRYSNFDSVLGAGESATRELSIKKTGDQFIAEIPRVALVGLAKKD
ncbi:class I SAM-dependent methyltransferase [Microbulbifer echini]|uniref:Class I SAM-dependent methyltransferase n=1 Tax=Microbulbifer echini TaxID=1529067 RepID=A0ABV4NQE4_9GAMM|nr:class I SAM-dependent methyltransferase [uncultured Microbulbifer sp.]